MCSALGWPSGSYTFSRGRRPSATMRNISNRLVPLEPMGFLLVTASSVLHHAGAQYAGSQPKESQVVHEDLEWILEDSEDPAVTHQVREGKYVKFLLLAAHQMLQMLSTALLTSCCPSLLKRPCIFRKAALRKNFVHGARVCGQARAACTSCLLKHLCMYKMPWQKRCRRLLRADCCFSQRTAHPYHTPLMWVRDFTAGVL